MGVVIYNAGDGVGGWMGGGGGEIWLCHNKTYVIPLGQFSVIAL